MPKKTVEIIASGYEWICPDCKHYNKEIEVTEHVTCEECKTKHEVKEFHHATMW